MVRRLIALSALLAFAGATDAEERRYQWLTQGEPSGSFVVDRADDGAITASFEFNDRGRGPKLAERVLLEDDGRIRELSVTGNSYMGAAVDEYYVHEDGIVRWRDGAEPGTGDPSREAFYVAAEGSPLQAELLARALLAAEGQSLPLWPTGEARIRELDRFRFADGAREEVVLYAVSGLGFTPSYLWMDTEQRIYALDYGWMGLVPEGQAARLPLLHERQQAAEEAYHRDIASRVTRRFDTPWCLTGIALLDLDAGRRVEGAAIRVDGDRIVALGDARGVACEGIEQVDGGGLTAMPGLWDMHTHLSASDGLLHVAAGVTGTRDMANDHDRLGRVMGQFASGEVVGTHVVRAGFIDAKGPYAAPTGMLAGSEEEALGFVDWHAERGYPQIKIYSSIDPAWVPAIAGRVHHHGMKLSGHIPSFMSASQAVRAGFDEIQHINMLFLEFLGGAEVDTRTPQRFIRVAEGAGSLDLDGEAVAGFIDLLAREGIVVDPTVMIFDGMFRQRAGAIDPGYAMIAGRVPPGVRRGFFSGGLKMEDEAQAMRYAASADALLAMVRRLHEAGVTIVPGTDALPGFALHTELELYQRAGIPALEVLRIATSTSARVAGQSDRSGRLAPGMRADIALVEGDPLADVSALRRNRMTVVAGRLYRSADLYAEVGVAPAK